MTAGIPGAGIAGLFYLICAIVMPLSALWRRRHGPTPRGPVHALAFVLRLTSMAAVMLGSLWAAGWAVVWALTAAPVAGNAAIEAAQSLPVAIGRGVVYFTAGTLAIVLAAVELVGLVVRRRARRSGHVGLLVALWLAGLAAPCHAQTPRENRELAAHLARAEAAYEREAFREAAEAYEAVLTIDPQHPRALFRLGQLRRDEPERAIPLFEAYTRVMPKDAWGHLALSSSLADAGRGDEALAVYERADALEPAERDIALGRPRLLARIGRPGQALAAYRHWLSRHPDDVEAWREMATVAERLRRWPAAADALERVRRANPDDERVAARLAAARARAAPAIDVAGLGIGETDVSTFGLQAGADFAAGDFARAGGFWHRRRISSFGDVVLSDRFMAQLAAQPSPELRVQLTAGLVRRRADAEASTALTTPEIRGRLRRRFARDRGGVDLRGQHGPVDATPGLALDELTRRLVSGAVDIPVAARWRARGLASVWRMARPDEDANRGVRIGGSLGFETAPGAFVSGGWQRSGYEKPGVGYFAPERAELIEGGLDLERERGMLAVSLDAGAGIQRVQRHGQAMGPWEAAFRGWGLLAWTLAPGRQVIVEVEAYDSRVTDRVVASTDRWRYASVTAGFRLATH